MEILRTFFIDPVNGNDNNSGLSTNSPVSTWNAANIGGTVLQPGDARLFKQGTINTPAGRFQFNLSVAPTSTNPVIFGSYGTSTQRAILDGLGTKDYAIFPPNNNATTTGAYVIVRDLEIRNFTVAGFWNAGTTTAETGHRVINCIVHDIGSTGAGNGIKMRGTDCAVISSTIYNTGLDGVFVEGARQYIGYNTIYDTGTQNTSPPGDDCIQAGNESPDSIVEYNVCDKTSRVWKQAILWLGHNSIVRNNKCFGSTDAAGLITLQNGSSMVAHGNFLQGTDGIYFLDSAGPCVASSNIIICTAQGTSDASSSGLDSNVAGHTFNNNTIIAMRRGIQAQGQRCLNNIIKNCTVMGIYAGTSVALEQTNCFYNNSTNIQSDTGVSLAINSTSIDIDPALDGNYVARTALVSRGGQDVNGGSDYYGNRFNNPPAIGAVQQYYAVNLQTPKLITDQTIGLGRTWATARRK